MNRILTWPNALSVTRLPIAFFIVWAALHDNWIVAWLLLLIGLVTDLLDGWLARRLDQVTWFGREILESVCDTVLAAGAVAGLVLTGAWPWWTVPALVVGAIGLQLVHQFRHHPNAFKRWTARHAYYAHPFYFVGVIVLTLVYYTVAAFDQWLLLLVIQALVTAAVVYIKRERWLGMMPSRSGL